MGIRRVSTREMTGERPRWPAAGRRWGMRRSNTSMWPLNRQGKLGAGIFRRPRLPASQPAKSARNMAGGVGRKGADFHRPRAFGRVDEARTGAENYPGAIGGLSPGV